MAYSAGQAAYKLAFEISPITLTNGIAGNIPGGAMPLMSLLQAANYSSGLLGDADFALDDAFGNFYPLPGSSLIENEVAKYPMANMAIAANAIIKQPLSVGLLMRCPVRDAGGYAQKLSIMTGLQNTLAQHCASGGTFIVATPSFFYTDCLLTGLHDVSGGEGAQAQVTWKFDFVKPLISLQDAQAAQNSMMQQLSNGTPTDGANSGLDAQSTATASSSGFLPASTGTASSGVPNVSSSQFSNTNYSGGSYFTGTWSPGIQR